MRRFLDGIYGSAAALAALCMVGLLVMVLLSIASRQLHFQVPGSDAYAGYLMAAAGFLALAHTLKRGEHIRVTLVINALSGASRKALEKAGWKAADLDLIEANEAFAAQACAVNKDMGWDTSKVNVNGGAIAIGHPIGASGARILNTLIHEMGRSGAKKGLATLCIGGGMGVAMCLERA